MPSYNSEVKYYRINANNTAIATSNSGTGTSSPTEEITAPVLGGTYVSGASGAVITGAATISGQDFNDLAENQYLYFIDSSNNGAYVLMGQIQAIDSATQVTLYDNSLATPSSSPADSLVGSYFLITNTESLYMRVACSTIGAAPNYTFIPDFGKWRTSSNVVSGVNNTSITKLERVSNVGIPVSSASPVENIPFTIQTMNVFSSGGGPLSGVGGSATFWPNTGLLPEYMWIRITPSVTNNILSSKTMYRFTTVETFEGLEVTINTLASYLSNNGYNIAQTSGSTQ
jgi:hypothetical protein